MKPLTTSIYTFSDLDNLTDLTMYRRAAMLLGYVQEEVDANFPDYIERLTTTLGMSIEETLQKLRAWYNGYKLGYPNLDISQSFSYWPMGKDGFNV